MKKILLSLILSIPPFTVIAQEQPLASLTFSEMPTEIKYKSTLSLSTSKPQLNLLSAKSKTIISEDAPSVAIREIADQEYKVLGLLLQLKMKSADKDFIDIQFTKPEEIQAFLAVLNEAAGQSKNSTDNDFHFALGGIVRNEDSSPIVIPFSTTKAYIFNKFSIQPSSPSSEKSNPSFFSRHKEFLLSVFIALGLTYIFILQTNT